MTRELSLTMVLRQDPGISKTSIPVFAEMTESATQLVNELRFQIQAGLRQDFGILHRSAKENENA
jgi:hypothetical protein